METSFSVTDKNTPTGKYLSGNSDNEFVGSLSEPRRDEREKNVLSFEWQETELGPQTAGKGDVVFVFGVNAETLMAESFIGRWKIYGDDKEYLWTGKRIANSTQ